jgi:hypothetical protein
MRNLGLTVCLILAITIQGAACVQPNNPKPSSEQTTLFPDVPLPVVQVVIHPEKSGIVIPSDFLGLAYDAPLLAGKYFDRDNRQFVNLLKNLGNGILNFGANGLEYTFWPRTPFSRFLFWNARAVLESKDIDRMVAFAKEAGWRIIFGLNLGTNNPDMAADIAAYVASVSGDSILAFEVGNEPDLYSRNGIRKSGYAYTDYYDEFSSYVQKIKLKVPDIPIAGPNVASRFQWFSDFLEDEANNIVFATNHHYPLNAHPDLIPSDPLHASIENLLSPVTMKRTADLARQYVNAAKAKGVSVRFDETNSSYPPKDGLGDVFAAALWGADYLFTLAEQGVSGVNFFGGMECHGYTPICFQKGYFGQRGQFHVQPLYYGLLFFHSAARGRLIPVEISTTLNVTAYATRDDDGHTCVAVINKEPLQSVIVQLQAPGFNSEATLIRLNADSLDAQEGITLAGSIVNEDGIWSPQAFEQIKADGNVYRVSVPAASAAAITLLLD